MAQKTNPINNPKVDFIHWDKIQKSYKHLFKIFQMSDPALKLNLFASLLVENAIILFSGTYGTGKTQLVHLIKTLLFSDGAGKYLFDYETCHQELTAFDVLYHLDLPALQQGKEIVHPKAMVTARLKFLNEIQRANTGFFNALLPLLSERKLTYRDYEFDAPEFVCIMDRNPLDVGSNEIPEAFLDRIDFSFDIPAIHLEEMLSLQDLRQQTQGYHWGRLDEMIIPELSFDQLNDIWMDVKRVSIPERTAMIAGMISDLFRLCVMVERSTARNDFDLGCDNCQFRGEICAHLQKVPGMRLTNSLFRLAQALAWMDKKLEVSEQHILAALPWSLSHRLIVRPEELRKKPSVESWVRETVISEIIRPKLPFWQRALKMYNERNIKGLEKLGENDLVVRELQILLMDRAG